MGEEPQKTEDQPQPNQPEAPEQTPAPEHPNLTIASSGMRTIQPVSDNTQPEQPDAADTTSESTEPPAAEQPAKPSTPDNPEPYPDRPKLDIAAVYPDSTPKFTDGVYQKAEEAESAEKTAPEKTRRAAIDLVIAILGGLIVLSSAANLIVAFRFAASTGSATTASLIIFALLGLVLGGGILTKNNTARLVYIALSVLTLLGNGIGIYHYATMQETESQNTKSFLAQEQRLETQYRASKTLTSAQKTQLIGQIQTQEQVLSHTQKNTRLLYTPILQLIVPIAAIVFLTRPTVRKEFS